MNPDEDGLGDLGVEVGGVDGEPETVLGADDALLRVRGDLEADAALLGAVVDLRPRVDGLGVLAKIATLCY